VDLCDANTHLVTGRRFPIGFDRSFCFVLSWVSYSYRFLKFNDERPAIEVGTFWDQPGHGIGQADVPPYCPNFHYEVFSLLKQTNLTLLGKRRLQPHLPFRLLNE